MKIALYHPWIYVKSGLERTILEIVSRSRHAYELYTSHYDAEGTFPELKNYKIQEINRVSVNRAYRSVLNAGFKIATTKMDLHNVDALIVCCDGLGSFITLKNGQKPIINLCFTPLRAAYDEEYRKRHLKKNSSKKIMALMIENAYRIVDRWLWKKYTKTISISETVKDRITKAGLFPENNIQVSYPGIYGERIEWSAQKEPFFFLPGRIMWTKNIELGIKGFLQFQQRAKQPYKLIIAGMVDKKSEPYYGKLKALASASRNISFHINPTDNMMQDWYKKCFCTLFTAFNEDLGLTPMEAMTYGKPVIAVNKGGPREVVDHNKTGLLLPADENSFGLGMLWLTENSSEAEQMGKQGMERVRRFTWSAFVESLDDTIEQVINTG